MKREKWQSYGSLYCGTTRNGVIQTRRPMRYGTDCLKRGWLSRHKRVWQSKKASRSGRLPFLGCFVCWSPTKWYHLIQGPDALLSLVET